MFGCEGILQFSSQTHTFSHLSTSTWWIPSSIIISCSWCMERPVIKPLTKHPNLANWLYCPLFKPKILRWMFCYEGAVGAAEPDVNLTSAKLNVAVIRVPAICSGNNPAAIGEDLTCLKGHRTRCKVLEDCYQKQLCSSYRTVGALLYNVASLFPPWHPGHPECKLDLLTGIHSWQQSGQLWVQHVAIQSSQRSNRSSRKQNRPSFASVQKCHHPVWLTLWMKEWVT